MHGHAAGVLLLQPVHPHIGDLGFRIFGDHQAKGDHAAGIAGPRADQWQLVEIQLLLAHHLLVAAGGEVTVGSGFDQIPQHARKAGELFEPFGRFGLLQQGEPAAEFLELFHALEPHAPSHPLNGAQQIEHQGHGTPLHVFKQQRRAAHGQHPISDRGGFQITIHWGGDAPELAPLLNEPQEIL